MISINVRERCGPDVSSRASAAQLRCNIVSTVDVDAAPVALDFQGVRTLSESFADELFAVLVEQRGEAWFKEFVRVQNLTDFARETVLEAIDERLRAAT